MIIVLVLVSAFLHAAWNVLLKREGDKDRALIVAVSVGALLAVGVAAVRAVGGVAPFAGVEGVTWALVAGAFEQLYFFGLARALDRGPLGPVYTISRGGAVVIVYPLSVALFAERVTVASLAGSGVVVLGLVLSGLRGAGTSDARRMVPAATAWASACACAIAAYHLAYKAALDAGGQTSAVFALSLSFASTISFVRTGRAGRRAIAALVRAHAARLVIMGLLCGGSFLMLIQALAEGGAGYALTLRNTSVLFALLLAWAAGEWPRLWPALGAAFVAAGAIMMTL
jgi:drug/metabolite transporter (DMT)-like permease